jgi:putative DNA methylase
MGARLMAIVAEGDRGRVYLAPTPEHEAAALKAKPEWKPEVADAGEPALFSPPLRLTTYGDLFTPRQLVALTTFSDLVQEARERVQRDALAAGLPDDGKPPARRRHRRHGVRRGGGGVFGVCVTKLLTTKLFNLRVGAGIATQSQSQHFRSASIPMTWDYAEVNPSRVGGQLRWAMS